MGFFSVITVIITWNINNQENESKQGVGFAMLQVIGQCGPLVGTRLYPATDAPFYISGMAICATAMVTVACLSLGLRLYLTRLNRRSEDEYEDRRVEGEGLVGGGKGRKKPFRYML